MKRALSIAAAVAMFGGAIAQVQADNCQNDNCGPEPVGTECGAIPYPSNNSGSLECGSRLWAGGRNNKVGVAFSDSRFDHAVALGVDHSGFGVCSTLSDNPNGVTVWSDAVPGCTPSGIEWIHYRMRP